ncbi:uncharacterized protein METZ01_LOCUS76999 [marine metagenome]|uniref:Beta-lactamase-related domain-containing protein n=1 Tax=marine metagenome TaxID=408172 RepID=A0A381U7C5_9ZZZZ
MKLFTKSQFILSIIFILCFSCEKPQFAFEKDSLNAIIGKFVQKASHPFIHVRLEDRHGHVIYEHNSVNQNFLPDQKIDGQTLMRIWSMSKIVTISLFMDLVEDQIVSLDDPVIEYLPEFSNLYVATDANGNSLTMVDSISKICPHELRLNTSEMTLRHLINHEAGFYYATTQNQCINSKMAEVNLPKAMNSDDLINRFAKLPLIQRPGDSHFYGTNTTILGLVSERATGKDLNELIQSRMTGPLRITGLKYNLEPDEKLLPRFSGKDDILRFANDGDFDIFGPDFPSNRPENKIFLGGEGMIASSDGYCDFLRMLMNYGELNHKQFLKPETVEEITSPQTQLDNDWGYNGYNLWVTSDTLRKLGYGDRELWQGGGYEGTEFWIDSRRGFVGVKMSQLHPIPKSGHEFYNEFRGEVYRQIFAFEEKYGKAIRF